VFAPLYDRAMQQALTQVAVDGASVTTSGVQLSAETESTTNVVPPPEFLAAHLPERYRADFAPPLLGLTANSDMLPSRGSDPIGDLSWRSEQCAHLTFSDGRCPESAGEIAVSAADARIFDLGIGKTPSVPGASHRMQLTVVGIYGQKPGDYWFARVLTGRSGVSSQDQPGRVQHDVWITPRETFATAGRGVSPRSSWAGFQIDPDRVGVDEMLALGPAITALDTTPTPLGSADIGVTSGLPDLAAQIQDQIDQSRVTVPLLMAQLALLAVVVLWLVLLAVTEQRRPEVALAQLRGRGRRGARRLLLAELLPLTVVGVLPGIALALVASWVARMSFLPGGPPFEVGWPVAASVGIAVAVLAVVTVVACVRVGREPVADLLRRVPPRQTGWGLGVADALVIAGCGAVVVLFASGGLEGPVVMVAPGLLAILVGLVLAHLTTPTAGLLGRSQLRRGRVRVGVSILDAARSPATRRTVAIVTLAAALAVFSADALLIGQRNRASAAEQAAGAPLVAEVQGTDLVGVRNALDEVDPDGRHVTPVVRVPKPASDAGETLAVLPDGFSSIALFPGGAPDASLWEALHPPEAEPILLTGRTFSVAVADSTLESVRVDGTPYPVTVGLDLATPDGDVLHTGLGRLSEATDHAVLHGTAPCTDGCTVIAIWFSSLPGAEISGTVTLGRLAVEPSGETVPLGPAGRWTSFKEGPTDEVVPTSEAPARLTIDVTGRGASLLTMTSAWVPTFVPTLTTGKLPPDATGRRFQISGLDAEQQPAKQVTALDRVPGSGITTYVANLDTLQRGRVVASTDRIEIWFSTNSSRLLADVRSALDDRGVSITRTTTLADVRQAYDDSAAAWSLQLAALVGALAILIALLVLVVSAVSSWRLRARDLAALRMGGVPTRTIRTIAVSAQLPAVLLGIVAGAGCGLVGTHLVMPTVPLFAVTPEVSTLDLGTAWTGVAVAVVAAVVVLALGSILIGRALAARSEVRRLREAGL
jgi:hypothetical protein